jgi:hypothetical protein
VSSLQAELSAATARSEALSSQVEAAAARDGGLRVAVRRLDEEHDRAQARLDAQVRRVWIHRLPAPIAWSTGLGSPALRRIAERGASHAVSVDRDLVEAVSAQSSAAVELRAQAESFRLSLRGQAEQALASQEAARVLLARAEADLAERLAAAAAQDERDRLAVEQATLIAARSALDAASTAVTVALTPRRAGAAGTRRRTRLLWWRWWRRPGPATRPATPPQDRC